METPGKEKSQPLSENLKIIRSVTDRHLAGVYKSLCASCSYMLRNSELLAEDVVAALELARDDLEKNLAKHQSTIELEETAEHKKRAQIIYDLICNVLNKLSTESLEYVTSEFKEGEIAEQLKAEPVTS